MRTPSEHKQVLEEDQLLYLLPFPDKLRRPTLDSALFRNRFVAALSEEILVPYASPDSKTFELCRLLISWRKAIYMLADEANALIDSGAQLIDARSITSEWDWGRLGLPTCRRCDSLGQGQVTPRHLGIVSTK
jgi:predicted Rossmann fold nucleotide-binding protein DprA/Smf involved in DNA uptake